MGKLDKVTMDLQRSAANSEQMFSKIEVEMHSMQESLKCITQLLANREVPSEVVQGSMVIIQNQSPGSFSTPTERIRGEGILPLSTLAIPFRTVEASQSVHKQESDSRRWNRQHQRWNLLDEGWIYRCMMGKTLMTGFSGLKCFSLNQTPEGDKLEMALACMTGCAVTCLRITQDMEDLKDWRDFKGKLKKRFKPTRGGTVIGQMLKLKQTGSVADYREQFEDKSAEVPHVTTDML